jgi:predicted glycoside hydrolase/deacetylase ChbG (UPF0249 family)
MKKIALTFLKVFLSMSLFSQSDNTVQLLVRADDIGSFHVANVGCIESYQNGIARSVELMPVCAWFPEAVQLLNENPGYDVGIHLTLTSEWSNVKWRPLTHCPSLVDENGYFLPMVWKNPNFPEGSSISESDWNLEEMEQELRAQIELSLKYVPHISHLSNHMGFTMLDPKITELVNRLAKEYNLEVNTEELQRFTGWDRDAPMEQRIEEFCENLEKLTPGKYLFVEHPAVASHEMKTVGHVGYENVAEDREWVTRVFISEKVKKIIHEKRIQLISYKDLK